MKEGGRAAFAVSVFFCAVGLLALSRIETNKHTQKDAEDDGGTVIVQELYMVPKRLRPLFEPDEGFDGTQVGSVELDEMHLLLLFKTIL